MFQRLLSYYGTTAFGVLHDVIRCKLLRKNKYYNILDKKKIGEVICAEVVLAPLLRNEYIDGMKNLSSFSPW
jgi:hypothetical protein